VPPFKPTIKDPNDMSNFDEKFTTMEAAESIITPDTDKIIREHKDEFEFF